jgi:hypothetical protein
MLTMQLAAGHPDGPISHNQRETLPFIPLLRVGWLTPAAEAYFAESGNGSANPPTS